MKNNFTEDDVLNSLKQGKKRFIDLAKSLRVRREDNKNFSFLLKKLERKGLIFQDRDGVFSIPIQKRIVKGEYKGTGRNFGFVELEDETSIFVPGSSQNGAIHGDIVEVIEVEDNFGNKDKTKGIIKRIIERKNENILGTIIKNNFGTFFDPINAKFKGKYRIKNFSEKQINRYAMAKIINSDDRFINIEIIKIFGDVNDPKAFIDSTIAESKVPVNFSSDVIEQIKSIPNEINSSDIGDRKDFRNDNVITIDGDDSKDFDDAIYVEKKDDHYLLFVHIADVAHYVQDDSPLDKDALKRGTSIYLADRVIPMLPEKLSNGICSLNPNVDRFTLTCKMKVNLDGEVIESEIFNSVIRSKHRLTYNDVNKFYDGNLEYDQELKEMLNIAKELSNSIGKKKAKQGFVDFEIQESKIILDEKGKTIDIKVIDRGFSQVMIENFMVITNETVAEYFNKLKKPFMYRIHDVPTLEKIQSFEKVLKLLDINVKFENYNNPKDFSKAINKIKEQSFSDFIKINILRTMQKAVYSSNNIGHFGLASKYYSHFTSPIRRYPDLMIHRIIKNYLANNDKEWSEAELEKISVKNSKSEVIAVELERKIDSLKKAEFYEDKVGEVKVGFITTVSKRGVFVEFEDKVNGFVHEKNFPQNSSIDPEKLIIKLNGETKRIGDKIKVIIDSIEWREGKIDLKIA
ncbi:MAG: ribonuclease R [Mycoplasma sp.]|nr:ribonuclease R [Mycoplasma sp.]